MSTKHFLHLVLALALVRAAGAFAQSSENAPPRAGDRPPVGDGPPGDGRFDFDGPPPFGPEGFGPGGPGPGGFGGAQEKQKLVQQFDKDGDHRLNAAERKAALEYLQKSRADGRGRRGPGGPGGNRGGFGGRGENQEAPQPGPKLSPADVKSFGDAPLYDLQTLRTAFLEFEDADWEKELAAFKNTDIEVTAKLTVDGKVFQDVGVHFRGMSSFMMVGEGRKRSLNLSLDFVHKEQQLGGYRTLDLLNSHEDPSFLRSVLSYQVARDYLPAPKANFMRVVINGESWGIYVNAQPFNKEFVKDWFGTTKGARWKVPGSPGGQGSLKYLGDDPAPYKRVYQIKTKDDPKSWSNLIRLCKVLNETPADKLEEALSPLLDIDGALKFLAVENALINNDGYWIRTSDYSLYEDGQGRFHVIPHDSNETFLRPEGGGGPGGPGGFRPDMRARETVSQTNAGGGQNAAFLRSEPGVPAGDRAVRSGGRGPGGPGFNRGPAVKGVELDPLVAANDANKPLLSKLLAVPALRTRYLGYVRDIAGNWLDWNKLGPLAQQYHALIAGDVKVDTRKLASTEAFSKSVVEDTQSEGGFGRQIISLKSFAEQRRAYLLSQSR